MGKAGNLRSRNNGLTRSHAASESYLDRQSLLDALGIRFALGRVTDRCLCPRRIGRSANEPILTETGRPDGCRAGSERAERGENQCDESRALAVWSLTKGHPVW